MKLTRVGPGHYVTSDGRVEIVIAEQMLLVKDAP